MSCFSLAYWINLSSFFLSAGPPLCHTELFCHSGLVSESHRTFSVMPFCHAALPLYGGERVSASCHMHSVMLNSFRNLLRSWHTSGWQCNSWWQKGPPVMLPYCQAEFSSATPRRCSMRSWDVSGWQKRLLTVVLVEVLKQVQDDKREASSGGFSGLHRIPLPSLL